MTVLDRAMDVARKRQARVVFPEADDPRIAAAMCRLGTEGLAQPVTVADTSALLIDCLVSRRDITETLARRMLQKPLIRAAAMVAAGQADAVVAGVATPTRKVIEAAGLAIGLADGVTLPSSFFLMRFPDGRDMIWADCALNLSPDAVGIAAIARASARSCAALIGPPRVALLSFSTGTSGTGSTVDAVRAAAESTGFTGPIQADAALDPVIATRKGIDAGNANVLIFPSLDAGNIAYKLAQQLAGAQALGPILQGFAAPVCDLSRGASVDDIVKSTLLTIALGAGG